MSRNFGKTWWGQQWLNALSNIDYANRLPRGSAYARKGSVVSLSITENMIKAKVKGSRPKPYDITIVVPPFFPPEIRKLTKALALRPTLISRLLNRELDPQILEVAERCGLKVFPSQWTDFKMQCSCPDWAVPCKHLAAIIYKVSAEIDNNPFLVFQLHKVDLGKELQRENIHIHESAYGSIPALESLLRKKDVKPVVGTEQKKAALPQHSLPDFSTLKPIGDALAGLLPDIPAFYQGNGNFREKYSLTLRRAIRQAERLVAGKVPMDAFFGVSTHRKPAKKTAEPIGIISPHTEVHLSVSAHFDAAIWLDGKKTRLTLNEFIGIIWAIPPGRLQDYQTSSAALRTVFLFCLNLLANGAVVPQLIRLADKSYAIRWLPALLSAEVKELAAQLALMLPEDILRHEDGTPADDPVLNLSSLLLTKLVQELSEPERGDLFLHLFFGQEKTPFSGPGEESLPGGINAWLRRYYFSQGAYRPALVIKELKKEQFEVSISIEEKDGLVAPVSLSDVMSLKKFEKARFEILQSLAQLSSFIPGLDAHINEGAAAPIILHVKDFASFLMDAIPAIRLLSINVLLPKSLRQVLRPQPSLRIRQKKEAGPGLLRLDQLLDFDWQVAIGDQVLDEQQFKKLLQASEGLIKYKSGYIYVAPADLEKLQKHFSSTKQLAPLDLLRTALLEEYGSSRASLSEEVKALIRELTAQKEIRLPEGLNAQLRPYQQRGVSWLYRNSRIGFGSVIADDMGLGKTLQVIAAILKYKEDGLLEGGKTLVIVPTGLLANWQVELEKFAPSLRYKVYHGLERKLGEKEHFDILLTSYGIARNEAATLRKMNWHVLVIDEAQNIKNHETAQSKAVKSIPANNFIAMSGTPVENRLSELWNIMDFSNRGLLGTLSEFRESFANPIQNQNDEEAAKKLKVVTGPFLLRRLKSDRSIIGDLPEKIEMDCFSVLAKEQASLYEKTLQKAMYAIEKIESADQKSLFARQGLVLQMILALKQICNHPAQFLKNKAADPSLSGKTQLLFDKLEGIREAGEKVLVFTQFTEMGNLMKQFITQRFGETPLFYHGGCTLKQRKEMVDSFQSNPADKIFILSLKAAGTGLNLTAARHVIHYDLWWNPAVEAQATDRAYRIGQKQHVLVNRFITKGTFEERINEMIQSKKALANMTVGTGESWLGNLSNRELRSIFQLG